MTVMLHAISVDIFSNVLRIIFILEKSKKANVFQFFFLESSSSCKQQ